MSRKIDCLIFVLLGIAVADLRPCSGQQLRRTSRPADEFLNAADEMFGTLFGETDQERQAIENVEIGIRQERQIGTNALEAFLAQLRHQGIRVEKRGRDVEYVQSLADRLRPLMRNARRYPAIQVYVARTNDLPHRSWALGNTIIMLPEGGASCHDGDLRGSSSSRP